MLSMGKGAIRDFGNRAGSSEDSVTKKVMIIFMMVGGINK